MAFLYLVAPFSESLVFLLPCPTAPSPSHGPAIVGNTVAALVSVAVCVVFEDMLLQVVLSVGLAIAATILCRALHPPAGAVGMIAA